MDEQTLRDNGVRRVVLMARDGDLDDDERRALLDALDAVPRGQAGDDDYAAFHWMRRAQRIERERDEARRECDEARKWGAALTRTLKKAEAERDRLRDLLAEFTPGRCECRALRGDRRPCSPCRARAALSDADADAEPDHGALVEDGCGSAWVRCGPDCDLQVVRPGKVQCNERDDACPNKTEPSRAEGDEQQQRCRWCGNWLPSCWWEAGPNHECAHRCVYAAAFTRAEYFRAKADAEGGRPREADPQGSGPSNGTGDASVDDGRSRAKPRQPEAHEDGFVRAWQAMSRLLDDAEGDEVPVDELLRAALASGGVVTEEDYAGLSRAWAIACHDAEDRVRELETALEPFARAAAAHEADRDTLTVSKSIVAPDLNVEPATVSDLRRARAALEGGDRG